MPADGAHGLFGIEKLQHLGFANDLFFLLQHQLKVIKADLTAAGKRLGEDGFYGGDGKALEGAHKLLEALLIHIHYDILGDIGDVLPQLRQGGQLEFQHADRGGQLLRDLIHRADDEDAFLLGLELHGKVFHHTADHIVLQETVEILEDIENGGIGGFFGDEIQHGDGIALAHSHADIKAGGEIPADDPHIFQLGGAVLHYRKEAFLLPGGDIQHGAAGADGQIEFFTEVHIFSPFGKGSVSAMGCKRRGRGKIGKGQGAADAILLSGEGRTDVSRGGNAAICDFHRPKPRKLQEGKAQRMGKICKAAQAFRGDGIGRRQYSGGIALRDKIREEGQGVAMGIILGQQAEGVLSILPLPR